VRLDYALLPVAVLILGGMACRSARAADLAADVPKGRNAQPKAVLPKDRAPSDPAEKSEWLEYPGNPVFTTDGAAAWPWVVYDAQQFGEGKNGPFYKLWYDRFDDGLDPWHGPLSIGLAVSKDGVKWADLGQIKRPGHGERAFAGHPCVLYNRAGFGRKAAPYRLYYWNGKGVSLEESADGVTWDAAKARRVIDATVCGGKGWESIYAVGVTYNDNGTPETPDDDQFIAAANLHGQPVALCSQDGIRWERPHYLYGGERRMLFTFLSMLRVRDGPYQIFYSFHDGEHQGTVPGGAAIGGVVAKSITEGVVPFSPPITIFHIRDRTPWRNAVTMCPCVIYDPKKFSGHGDGALCKMWFAGGDDRRRSGIGYAVFASRTVGGKPNPGLAAEGWTLPLRRR